MRRLAVVLALVALAAGCGGSKAKPDHATLTSVTVRTHSVEFAFDSAPQTVKTRYSSKADVFECGSGAPVRKRGSAVYLVHFMPAQSQDVPKQIVMASGPVLQATKFCDFEADVGWAIALETRLPADVSRDGSTVTVTFGG